MTEPRHNSIICSIIACISYVNNIRSIKFNIFYQTGSPSISYKETAVGILKTKETKKGKQIKIISKWDKQSSRHPVLGAF
jgi:hypothetical protein